MSGTITIALDAMGGDRAPDVVLKGADIALERYPGAQFLLFGAESQIAPLLAQLPRVAKVASLHHTSEMVAADDKPSQALRAGRNSSMRLAIDAVAEGRADGVVSAGNTGALMAIAKFVLKTMPGIDRPAIAAFLPTRRSESVMLDLGANIECDAENLVQFALLGDAFARSVLGVTEPTVGLLNVGSEDLKGNDAVRGAAARLRGGLTPIRFHGFVEGDDIGAGTVDVIVTDGFTGNVALKTAEGSLKLYAEALRSSFRHSPMARIGYVFARGALKKFAARFEPREIGADLVEEAVHLHVDGDADRVGEAECIGGAVTLDDDAAQP